MRSSYLDNREAMVTELDRIRNVLRKVLSKIDKNNRSGGGGEVPVAQFEEAQQTVETLKVELEEQIMANSLLQADSKYLEQQLKEKVLFYFYFFQSYTHTTIRLY
jgi:multidrug efflux pump subunit AcrA (membrane-fusion protein)